MQSGLTDRDSHVSMPGGREPNCPPELLESSLRVDRRRDANRSGSHDSGPTSFRFDEVDCDCQLTDINQGRVDRDRHRKRIVE